MGSSNETQGVTVALRAQSNLSHMLRLHLTCSLLRTHTPVSSHFCSFNKH